MTERYIAGAALQLKENPNIVVIAEDHYSQSMIDQLLNLGLIEWGIENIGNLFNKGYIDNKGLFIDSIEEVSLIAKTAGQIPQEANLEELSFVDFKPKSKIFAYAIRFLSKNGVASVFIGPNYNFIMKLIYAVGFKAYNHEYGFAVLKEGSLKYLSTTQVKNKFGTDEFKLFRSL